MDLNSRNPNYYKVNFFKKKTANILIRPNNTKSLSVFKNITASIIDTRRSSRDGLISQKDIGSCYDPMKQIKYIKKNKTDNFILNCSNLNNIESGRDYSTPLITKKESEDRHFSLPKINIQKSIKRDNTSYTNKKDSCKRLYCSPLINKQETLTRLYDSPQINIQELFPKKFNSPQVIDQDSIMKQTVFPLKYYCESSRKNNDSKSTERMETKNYSTSLKSDNFFLLQKENFLSINTSNLSKFISFLTIWNEMETANNSKTLLMNSKRFVHEFESYFIKIDNTVNIFEEACLNSLFQKMFKLSLIIVCYIIVFLSECNDTITIKDSFKKMITTLNESFCLIYELFLFHDKNLVLKKISKEFSEKIQKIANVNYNTFLNKSFKKNKIKEISSIISKILDNLINQIKTFSSKELNNIYVKICSNLLDKIDEYKMSNFAKLILNNVIFCIMNCNDSNKITKDLNFINYETPYLPSISRNYIYTVVLDLDETLIYYINNPSRATFIIRPKCFEFLKEISSFCEVVIFTSATKEYADNILNCIDPSYTLIKYRLYRHHTRRENNLVIKDLVDLGRDLTKILIIDNLEENYINQYDNGLLSLTWKDDIFDTQLNDFLRIIKFIHEKKIENIPDFISKMNKEIGKIRESTYEANIYCRINLNSIIL